jgi:hypothetical protein
MTPNQKKYYILALKDVVIEIRTEIFCCEIEFQGEALIAARYALRNVSLLLQDLIEGVQNNS